MGCTLMFFKKLVGMAVVAVGLSSAPSFAATLNVDGSGQLLGASGVNVGGTLYDVLFKDGTCIAVFDGCDEVSDFAFTTSSAAYAASQALLDQVFVDVSAGSFDSAPALTIGIDDPRVGFAFTPYDYSPDFSGNPKAYGSCAINQDSSRADSPSEFCFSVTSPYSTSDQSAYVWAEWTLTAVPLPAGGMLLLTALGGIAALRRRKKTTA